MKTRVVWTVIKMMMMEPLEMDTKLAGGMSTGPIAGRQKRSNREKETTPMHALYVPRRHGRASGRGRQSQLEMSAMNVVGVLVGWLWTRHLSLGLDNGVVTRRLDGDKIERVGVMKKVGETDPAKIDYVSVHSTSHGIRSAGR
jgi:hypothetical protein